MLKASNDEVIFLGINDKNVEMLKQGKPIFIDEPMLGIGKTIVIHYHPDLNELAKILQDGRLDGV